MASISHRYSIRWLPHRASEPTSTLVLTLESGFYIDIRIIGGASGQVPPFLPASADALLKLPNEEEVEIDWAFAGQSTSEEGPPRKCKWDHWIDSKTNLLDDEPISDSGFMYPQDDGLMLEKGSMPNPETGENTDYEEVWEDLPVTRSQELKYEYYVLTHDEPTEDQRGRSRGVLMQCGIWFQAILRIDRYKWGTDGEVETELRVVRWKWIEAERTWRCLLDDPTGAWKVLTPDGIETRLISNQVKPGDDVEIKKRRWTCKEAKRTENAEG